MSNSCADDGSPSGSCETAAADFDARQRGEALERGADVLLAGCDRSIPRRREEDFEAEHAVGIEAGRHRRQPREAFEQQRRRRPRASWPAPPRRRSDTAPRMAAPPRTRPPTPSFSAACDEIRSTRTAGASAGSAPASIATTNVNASTAAVDRGFVEPRHIRRAERHDEADGAVGERDAAGAADRATARGFRSATARRRGPAGAERETNRGLAPARRRPREQQVRHVGARDQQDEADGADEHQQRRLGVADDRVVQRPSSRTRQPLFVSG